MAKVTHKRLMELVTYEPETGRFRLNETGEFIGFTNKAGHGRVVLDGKFYTTARLAWFYMTGEWPAAEIDHKNRDRRDHRWNNLREATHSQNQANRRLFRNNKARVRGVHRCKHGWRAMISKDGKNRHIGYFDTKSAAAQAWKVEAMKVHGEFAAVR